MRESEPAVTMTAIRIAIHGAAGRMGRRLIALAAADPQLTVAAALESPGNALLGNDAGTVAGCGALGVPLAAELLAAVDVVVDFSVPSAAETIVETCRQRGLPLVLATTGFVPEQIERIRAAANEIPVLWSPSMSMAVNLAMKLCQLAGKALADKDADVEILERHHRFKEDSPSGTALKFGEIIAAEMGQTGSAWTQRPARQAAAPGDRLPRHPHGRQSRRAHDYLRHARRDARTDRRGRAIAIAMPRRLAARNSSPASRRGCTE